MIIPGFGQLYGRENAFTLPRIFLTWSATPIRTRRARTVMPREEFHGIDPATGQWTIWGFDSKGRVYKGVGESAKAGSTRT
jgi:hypothetical protein